MKKIDLLKVNKEYLEYIKLKESKTANSTAKIIANSNNPTVLEEVGKIRTELMVVFSQIKEILKNTEELIQEQAIIDSIKDDGIHKFLNNEVEKINAIANRNMILCQEHFQKLNVLENINKDFVEVIRELKTASNYYKDEADETGSN